MHGAGDAVVFAFDAHHAWRGDIPDPADDVNRLAKRSHGLRWRAPHTPPWPRLHPRRWYRLDQCRVRSGQRTEGSSSPLPELQECRGVRKAELRTYPDSRTRSVLADHVGQQRPGVEEPRVARVVHKRDEVQTGLLSRLGQPNHVMRVLVLQGDGVQIICQ